MKLIAEIKGQSKTTRLIFAKKYGDNYLYDVANQESQITHRALNSFDQAVKYACEDLNLIRYLRD